MAPWQRRHPVPSASRHNIPEAGLIERLAPHRLTVAHSVILSDVNKHAALTAGFAFMTVMSLCLATLGLLLNSPSVIIGAMLVSPLMDPIIAIGFALASIDLALLIKGFRTLLTGVLLAILAALLLVALSPINDLTAEILARTRPNLFDLLVAFFSGLVAGYAIVRIKNTAIVGVAIATALMPPLATIGFGLATRQIWVAKGAALLFVTNATSIAVGVAIMAVWFGFGRFVSQRILLGQGLTTAAIGIAILLPLLDSLRSIAEEVGVKQMVRKVLAAQIENNLTNLMGEYRVNLLQDGSVQVLGIAYVEKIGRELENMMTQDLEVSLGRKVNVVLKQIPVRDIEAIKEKSTPPPGVIPPSAVANPIQPVPNPIKPPAKPEPDAQTAPVGDATPHESP
ncbi:MAG: DUF389 domain-containing protein [Magnetococcales bacterium]|nr:DUF389 domain-containing protein [Magnetococcales bacterium]